MCLVLGSNTLLPTRNMKGKILFSSVTELPPIRRYCCPASWIIYSALYCKIGFVLGGFCQTKESIYSSDARRTNREYCSMQEYKGKEGAVFSINSAWKIGHPVAEWGNCIPLSHQIQTSSWWQPLQHCFWLISWCYSLFLEWDEALLIDKTVPSSPHISSTFVGNLFFPFSLAL